MSHFYIFTLATFPGDMQEILDPIYKHRKKNRDFVV